MNCAVCPKKGCADGADFQQPDATPYKTPVYTDVKWDKLYVSSGL